MEDATAGTPARFRPTGRQAFARGLYLGVLVSAGTVPVALVVGLSGAPTPSWLWIALLVAVPVAGVLMGLTVARRVGTEVDAGGIRTVSGFTRVVQPWNRVVDLRAERRGARTVVSVYLDSGASVQLRAPYDGGLFAADPQFEFKVFALANLWRSHRVGGLAG
jgi:hypothetical protein